MPATADPPTPTIATVIVATLAKGSSLGRSLVTSGAENGSAANNNLLLTTASIFSASYAAAHTLCIKSVVLMVPAGGL